MSAAKDAPPEAGSPEEIIAAAESEVSDASGLVDALEDKVRQGDADVTPDAIDKARSVLHFATLRKAAAASKAAALAEQQRLARDAAFIAKWRPIVDAPPDDRFRELFDQARDLLKQAIAIGKEYDQSVMTIAAYAAQNSVVADGEAVAGVFEHQMPEKAYFLIGDKLYQQRYPAASIKDQFLHEAGLGLG